MMGHGPARLGRFPALTILFTSVVIMYTPLSHDEGIMNATHRTPYHAASCYALLRNSTAIGPRQGQVRHDS